MARDLYGTVIVTYRCNAHCNMCAGFKYPTKPEEEITMDVIRKLPAMAALTPANSATAHRWFLLHR